jgi:hypothetical protein
MDEGMMDNFRTLKKGIFGTAKLASVYFGEDPKSKAFLELLWLKAAADLSNAPLDHTGQSYDHVVRAGLYPIVTLYCDHVFKQTLQGRQLMEYVNGPDQDSYEYFVYYAPCDEIRRIYGGILHEARLYFKRKNENRIERYMRVEKGMRLVAAYFPLECLPGFSDRPLAVYTPLLC